MNYLLSQGEQEYGNLESKGDSIERLSGRPMWYFGIRQENTGFKKIWDLKEVNYSKLAEKMYGIDKENKIQLLDNGKWLVWVKI